MASHDHESERPAGSNAPREKKRGSQESQSRLGTRHQYLAVERSLNAQSTLRQWTVGVCSTGVSRARRGAQAQSIALLAH